MRRFKLAALTITVLLITLCGCPQDNDDNKDTNGKQGHEQVTDEKKTTGYYRDLARIQITHKMPEDAVANLKKAIELADDNNAKADTCAELAKLYFDLKREKDSRECLEKALDLATALKLKTIIHQLAYRIYLSSGETTEATISLYFVKHHVRHRNAMSWVQKQQSVLFASEEKTSEIASALESRIKKDATDVETLIILRDIYKKPSQGSRQDSLLPQKTRRGRRPLSP